MSALLQPLSKSTPQPGTIPSCRFPALQRLDLSACRRAQDGELRGLTGLRELGALRLDGLDALTDSGVALLVPLRAQLTALSLRNCSKVRHCLQPCAAHRIEPAGARTIQPGLHDGRHGESFALPMPWRWRNKSHLSPT